MHNVLITYAIKQLDEMKFKWQPGSILLNKQLNNICFPILFHNQNLISVFKFN